MVEFKWFVTDNIAEYEFTFDPKTEPLLVYGYFQMNLNGFTWGQFYDSLKTEKEIGVSLGSEDVLSILCEMKRNVISMENGTVSEIWPMWEVTTRLEFERKEEKLIISQIEHDGAPKVYWKQTVSFEEFANETKRNIKLFIQYIQKENSSLIENTSIKSLAEGIVEI